MNLYQEVRTVLAAEDKITAIVGAGVNTRIWSRWPRTYNTPCIVMEIDEDAENPDLATGTGDLIISAVTITCRADTSNGARALWALVRSLLAGYAGVFDAVLDSTGDAEVPKAEGSTEHWYDRVMDFTMFRSEPV